jgi:hypothetical protein
MARWRPRKIEAKTRTIPDQRKVALRDRGDRERAQARPAEDVLRQNRAAEKRAESDTEDAHHRKERVSERVGDDPDVGKAASAGGAHVGFVQGVEERRPHQADRDGREPDSEREGREDEVREPSTAGNQLQARRRARSGESRPEHRHRD